MVGFLCWIISASHSTCAAILAQHTLMLISLWHLDILFRYFPVFVDFMLHIHSLSYLIS